MTTSSRRDRGLAPGVTFCPRERDLTDVYLRRKITGVDLPDATGRFFHVADVYSAEPEKLTEKFDEAPGAEPAWYFFSPVRYVGGRKTNARGGVGRKSRTIDGGAGKHWWHSEKREMPVKGGSDYGGYKQYFSYKVKNASTGEEERAGWIMTEYGISPEHGGGDLVLCEIHPSPRAVASNPIVNSKKRKAASTVEDAMTPEDAAEQQQRQTGYELVFDEDFMAEFRTKSPQVFDGVVGGGAAGFTDHQSADQAALPLYQNDMVMPVGDLAALPCAPAAQPDDDDDATGLVQTISEYEFPRQNYNDDGQMEDPTASARPRRTADQDEHQLQAASSVEDTMTPQDAAEQDRHAEYELEFDEDFKAEFRMKFPELFDGEPETEDFADQAAPSPLSNFLQNVEQDFRSEYQNDMVMPVGDLAALPWSPAAQPDDDDAATGLMQTISAYGFPGQNYHDDGQMEASFREEQTEHDKTAAGKVVYGFPCPAFSPEMIRGCSNDVPMPWQSSSSMSTTFRL